MSRIFKIKGSLQTTCILGLLCLLSGISGCNEEFPNLLTQDYPEDSTKIRNDVPKVLYVIVDGLSGDALRSIDESKIPTISEMNEKALYAYDALADGIESPSGIANATGWANLMTGVTKTKHGVENGDFSNSNLETYPSMVTRLKNVLPDTRSAVFGTSAMFIEQFGADATVKSSFNTDMETSAAVVEELENEAASFIVAQFHGVEVAGNTAEFDPANSTYSAAIEEIDSFIKNIKTALENRASYAKENWLVVLTSGKGGVKEGSGGTAFDDQSRNIFTILYSPKFESKFIARPSDVAYINNGVRFKGVNSKGRLEDVSEYNFGVHGNYTIQLTIKSGLDPLNYPTILSKRAEAFTGSGWQIFLAGDHWEFRSANMGGFLSGSKVNDNDWHTITVVYDGVNKLVKAYTDGVFNQSAAMNDVNLDNDIPLALGQIGSNYTNANLDILITNVQIYHTAFTDGDVSAYACKTFIDESHIHYDDLIGYWPGYTLGATRLEEVTGNGGDFLLQGPYVWDSFNDLSSNLCPPIEPSYYRGVPNAVDMPFQIFNWLGVQVPADWALDGMGWTPSYRNVKP